MTAEKRLVLLAGLASALVLTGCPGEEIVTPDGGTDHVPDTSCVDDTDCEDPNLFFCNTTTSTCQPACRSKQDCSSSVRGEFALAYCDNNPLGCQCDEGTCVASLCSADSDCGGGTSVCRDGACVVMPDVATAQKCQITPDVALMKTGKTATFWVSFWDASNKPVVLTNDQVTWTAAQPLVTGGGNGLSQTFTGATVGPLVNGVIKVSAGGAECTAAVGVLSSTVPTTDVRVTVVNELTGRPISGATVVVSESSTSANLASGQTDSNGSVNVAAAGEVTVSVFHVDYTYVSVVGYNTVGASRDLYIALRRNQVDRYGGYKGTFTDVPETPNIHAGLAGMSIAGAVTDLSVSQLLGHSVPRHVKIGSAIDEQNVPIPAGAYLKFSSEPAIAGDVAAQGLAGVCTADLGLTSVEQAINEGRCGTRSAWALSGDIPLGDLPISAVSGGFDNIDYGAVLGQVLPIFKRFNSSVVRDVQFKLEPTAGAEDGNPDFSNTEHFTAGVDHDFDKMPLGFAFAVNVPTLPNFLGSPADAVVVLGGADVRGRGVIPLGLGAGINTTPNDGKVDTQGGLPSAGLMLMRMAPTHSGIEGAEYALVAVALSQKSINDAAAGVGMSALLQRLPGNKLVFDPKGTSPVELTGAFLDYPEKAKYNFTDDAQPGLNPRTFRFMGGAAPANTQLIRVQFSDRTQRRWQVLINPASNWTAGVKLPKPPSGFADRTFYSNASTGGRSPIQVQALQLKNGAEAISFRDLVEFNGTNLDRLNDWMTAFSAIDYGRPEISWTAPTHGATIARGSALGLKVDGFRIGTGADDDGTAKITFTGGTGCTDLEISQDASQGAGELSATLPSSCEGTVQMTATLHGPNGQPIAPAVSRAISVTIQ